jgi:hypothetical protein
VSTRATYLLLAVLLVLAAIAFFVLGPGSADRPHASAPLVPGLKTADVGAVRMTAGGVEVLLTRAGGAWKLGAAKVPADGAAVEALLTKVAGAREEAVVSVNRAKQGVYETEAGKGIAVQLEGSHGNVIAAFVIGKGGPDFASCYLRREGAPQVLLVTPDLRADFARPAESWREPPKNPEPPAATPAAGGATK